MKNLAKFAFYVIVLFVISLAIFTIAYGFESNDSYLLAIDNSKEIINIFIDKLK